MNTRFISGVPFVSPHGVTGLTVEPGNSGELATVIDLLLDDPARRSAYGTAARQRAREKFSLDEMVDRTLAVYHEALAWRTKRGPNG